MMRIAKKKERIVYTMRKISKRKKKKETLKVWSPCLGVRNPRVDKTPALLGCQHTAEYSPWIHPK